MSAAKTSGCEPLGLMVNAFSAQMAMGLAFRCLTGFGAPFVSGGEMAGRNPAIAIAEPFIGPTDPSHHYVH
jgi:hypothetical protein